MTNKTKTDRDKGLKMEADAIVSYAFRNGPIEDLHGDDHLNELTNRVGSVITQKEMKEIMVYACENLHNLLILKHEQPEEYSKLILEQYKGYCKEWYLPKH